MVRARFSRFGVGARSRAGALTAAAALAAFAVAGVGAAPAQAGLSSGDWTAATLPTNYLVGNGQDGVPLSPVSCVAGTQFCAAVVSDTANLINFHIGQGVAVTTDGGQTWTGYAGLPSGLFVTAISCPTTSSCWAVGYNGDNPAVAQSTDGGQTWTDATPAAWDGAQWLARGIDCVSATTCWVVGTDYGMTDPAVAETTDGGATWTMFTNIPTPANGDPYDDYALNAISCTTALDCVAVGGFNGLGGTASVFATTDGGATWAASQDPALTGAQDLFGVSCVPGAGGIPACYASGSALTAIGPVELTSLDGGTTWSGVETYDDTGWLNSISCADATHCWAAGAGTSVALVGTDNGGTAWSAATSDTTNEDGSVSCASADLCVATTDNALWVTSNDGGLGARAIRPLSGRPARATPAGQPLYRALPKVSSATVWVRAGRPVTVTAQYRGRQAATSATVTIQPPGGKAASHKVTIGLNHFYSASIPAAAQGVTKVTLTAGNAPKQVIEVHGHPAAAPTVTSISSPAGPAAGGTTLTLKGSGFRGVTAVDFGSVAGTRLHVLSATKLTIRTSAGTGARYVTVVTRRGGPSALTSRAVYNFMPAPRLTGLSPARGPASGGTTVTITGSGLAFARTVDFGSHAATGVRVISAREIQARAPAGSGTVQIRVITAGGTTPVAKAGLYTYSS